MCSSLLNLNYMVAVGTLCSSWIVDLDRPFFPFGRSRISLSIFSLFCYNWITLMRKWNIKWTIWYWPKHFGTGPSNIGTFFLLHLGIISLDQFLLFICPVWYLLSPHVWILAELVSLIFKSHINLAPRHFHISQFKSFWGTRNISQFFFICKMANDGNRNFKRANL